MSSNGSSPSPTMPSPSDRELIEKPIQIDAKAEGQAASVPPQTDVAEPTPQEIETVSTIPTKRKPILAITLGFMALIAVSGTCGYIYWKNYQESHTKIQEAKALYEQACQPSQWQSLSAVNTAKESIHQATTRLQAVPNVPGLGYTIAQQELANISQCSSQLQSQDAFLSHYNSLVELVGGLTNEFISFFNSLQSGLGYEAYSEELSQLDQRIAEFQQSPAYAEIQNQNPGNALREAVKSLERSQDRFHFAQQAWATCRAEEACFRGMWNNRAMLISSSTSMSEIVARLIDEYQMTPDHSPEYMIDWLRGYQGVPLNAALNTVWGAAKQDIVVAQQEITSEASRISTAMP